MHIIELDDLSRPELAPFARLTEAQLRNRRDPEQGLFIAESPKVIEKALDSRLPACLLSHGAPAHRWPGARTSGPVRRGPRLHRGPGAAGRADRLRPHPGHFMRHAPPRPAGGFRPVRLRPPPCGAGWDRGSSQRGSHFPLRRRPWDGRCPADPQLLRSPVPQGPPGSAWGRSSRSPGAVWTGISPTGPACSGSRASRRLPWPSGTAPFPLMTPPWPGAPSGPCSGHRGGWTVRTGHSGL